MIVVTIRSLKGETIEYYSIQLANKWKPGQVNKDNGVILLVAPNEKRIRIEVGYGLEATLTDAAVKGIIETEIIPHFKKEDYPTGIKKGVEAIIRRLSGGYIPYAKAYPVEEIKFPLKKAVIPGAIFLGLIFIIFIFVFFGTPKGYAKYRARYRNLTARGIYTSSYSGYSGGGGSFGGGGASGSW